MNLEELFKIDYNWADLFLVTLILVLIYLALIFIQKIIESVLFVGRFRTTIKKFLDLTLTFYEPITALVITSIFVMIRPAFHGLIIGIVILLGFTHIRNYFHSRLVLSDRSLKVGRRIKIMDQEGIITNLGRLGIQVRIVDGLHFLPYHTLVNQGFVLSSGDKIGGYYHLNIKPQNTEREQDAREELSYILISSPYVDGDHKPEISRSIGSDGGMNVKLLVKEEDHVYDLITLLEEKGYSSTITKS